MTRRALLIGSQTLGLRGVEEDVRRMARVLCHRGFVVDHRTGPDASRAGILDGLARLARDAGSTDVVCVYYSGHGARIPVGTNVIRAAGRIEPREIRFLVPTDHARSTDDDFRGITTWELSLWLASLTARTRDVTTIFDCCHAARIVRDGEPGRATARGLPHPSSTGLPAHLAALKAQGARFELLDPLGNPHAVRLFAAAESGFAWESERDGVWCGAMTDELVRCLERAGDRAVPWSAIAAVVRERVRRRFADQQPELAGPVGRSVFSGEASEGRRALGVVVVHDDRAVLRAGRIAGICRGDSFDLVPFDADADAESAIAARAIVDTVDAFEATVFLDARCVVAHVDDLVAYPRTRALPILVVRCVGDANARQRLGEVAWLDVTEDEDPRARLTVELRDGVWTISDRDGPLRRPVPSAHGLEAVVEVLADLSRAGALRMLEGDHGLAASSIDVALVSPGAAGEPLAPGDVFVVRIDNRSPAALYVHVFQVAPHGDITRLTLDSPLGLSIAPGALHVLGGADAGPAGLAARWPEELPEDAPREIDLIVIAATRGIDLGFLERRVRAWPLVTRGAGQLRDIEAPTMMAAGQEADLGFAVVRRSYGLRPTRAEDARIEACTDLATSNRWHDRAVTAVSVSDVLE